MQCPFVWRRRRGGERWWEQKVPFKYFDILQLWYSILVINTHGNLPIWASCTFSDVPKSHISGNIWDSTFFLPAFWLSLTKSFRSFTKNGKIQHHSELWVWMTSLNMFTSSCHLVYFQTCYPFTPGVTFRARNYILKSKSVEWWCSF